MRIFRWMAVHLTVPAICLAAGWYLGDRYGAPDYFTDTVDSAVARGKKTLAPIVTAGVERGRAAVTLNIEQASGYVTGTVERMFVPEAGQPDMSQLVVALPPPQPAGPLPSGATGEAPANSPVRTPAEAPLPGADPGPETGSESGPAGMTLASLPQPKPGTHAAPRGNAVPDEALAICPMRVSNPPRGGTPASAIGAAGETIRVADVALMLMPVSNGCLSSGFGPRGMGRHRGVDYFSKSGGQVLAAGDGIVVEAVARSDYGNMIVIDHGSGVFTRYGHLAKFAAGLKVGTEVTLGQNLGPIGATGATTVVHLHYEVLTGEYLSPAGSFGLTPSNPFAYSG